MRKYVTMAGLKRAGACEEAQVDFKWVFGERAAITEANAQRWLDEAKFPWHASNLLKAGDFMKYQAWEAENFAKPPIVGLMKALDVYARSEE